MIGTSDLFAMKKLRKSEMIKKDQVWHVRNERALLAEINNSYNHNPWVVNLYFSFQDQNYLYLIMEYISGGDMMTMLIKYDTFSEDWTRFYIAQTILAIHSVHKLNYIHRSLLLSFSLCTCFTSRTNTLKRSFSPTSHSLSLSLFPSPMSAQ